MTTAIDPPHHTGDGIQPPTAREPSLQAFTWPTRRPVLCADWRNLAMLNYEIDPQVLKPFVPAGTELDVWNGKTYASIIGFQFQNVRLLGLRVPFHINFEEVNLRFYVRRRAEEGWRRGAVFISEIVPRRAVALTARWLYGENYRAVPMSHAISPRAKPEDEAPQRVEYRWHFRNQRCHLAVETAGGAYLPKPDSQEEFIVEHYWGYTALTRNRAKEYRVAHRTWRVSPATRVEFEGDVGALYGPQFTPFLQGGPASAFWADGSAVRVYPGKRL